MNYPSHEFSIAIETVPTPTIEYRSTKKFKKATQSSFVRPAQEESEEVALTPATGSRVLIYKQDPSVTEIGLRKVYIASPLSDGPADVRIISEGLPQISKNSFGDFIQTPGTDAFDAVQTFAVVRMTLTMVQRALQSVGIFNAIPWQWNSPRDRTPISVHAHGLPDTMNAFYSRSLRSLKFGDFTRPGSAPPSKVFTCRSLDIVAHETGHAILDSLQPGWISSSAPQTGGLHESFGDITAIFLTLSQLDQVEAVIAQTKANLHDKTFLSDMAEEFGLALGRPSGLRNADNDLKLSETGNEVHAISQVFTGGIYDVLADIFVLERKPEAIDDAKILLDVSQYLYALVLRAIIESKNATYADVVNNMLSICASDGKPVEYRDSIRERFEFREVVVTPKTLAKGNDEHLRMDAGIVNVKGTYGSRNTCCGTMKHDEYLPKTLKLDYQAAMLDRHFNEKKLQSNGHEKN